MIPKLHKYLLLMFESLVILNRCQNLIVLINGSRNKIAIALVNAVLKREKKVQKRAPRGVSLI